MNDVTKSTNSIIKIFSPKTNISISFNSENII